MPVDDDETINVGRNTAETRDTRGVLRVRSRSKAHGNCLHDLEILILGSGVRWS